MNPEIVSFQYATGMCLLLENVGGSEQDRSVIADVQSEDLWPSRMHAATGGDPDSLLQFFTPVMHFQRDSNSSLLFATCQH